MHISNISCKITFTISRQIQRMEYLIITPYTTQICCHISTRSIDIPANLVKNLHRFSRNILGLNQLSGNEILRNLISWSKESVSLCLADFILFKSRLDTLQIVFKRILPTSFHEIKCSGITLFRITFTASADFIRERIIKQKRFRDNMFNLNIQTIEKFSRTHRLATIEATLT